MSRLHDEPCDFSEAEARDYIAGKLTPAQVELLVAIDERRYKTDGRKRHALKALLAFVVVVKAPHNFEYWTTPRGHYVLARLQKNGRAP